MFATLLSPPEGVFYDAADAERRVDADLGGHFMCGADADRAASPGVRTFRALADHHEIDIGAGLDPQWAADARIQPARSQVDMVVQLESQA
jgi:hypothetical protein